MADSELETSLLGGRRILLTGATSVLGQAFACALHDSGAQLALVARRRDELEQLADRLPGAVAVKADLSDAASLVDVVERARSSMGAIDTLINGAAVGSTGASAQAETPEQISSTLQVNVVAPLVLSQLVYSDMVAHGAGCIINVGSIAGEVGIGRFPQASYAASKGALHSLTRELAAQWSRHGIRVNTLAPGFFKSDMTAALYEAEKPEQWIRSGLMNPRHGEAQDMVGALLFLASEASAYMTGQVLLIDGGWTAR